MSGPNDQKVPPQHQEYYPPPPPGPPPAHANPLGSNPHPQYTTHQQSVPQHPNEHALPDYYATHPQAQQHNFQHEPDASELYGTDDPIPPQHHAGATTAGGPAATKSSWSSRLAGLGTKVSSPLNALANKLGSEAFLPGTMDKECEKAARILRGFCKEGIYSDSPLPNPPQQTTTTTDFKPPPTTTSASHPGPASSSSDPAKKKPARVLLTIPPKVIARAQGLAIFTTARAGFHVTGATGSGVLVARRPDDGSWSPPSGIQVHSLGAGFVVGLDIYDCVVVINTREALEAFTRMRMSLGSDLAVAAGPWGAGGSVDFGVPREEKGKGREREKEEGKGKTSAAGQVGGTTDHVYHAAGTSSAPGSAGAAMAAPPTGTSKERKPSPFREAIRKPVYSYVKSRGFYAGVQVDGTVITERKDANAAFYGDKNITVERILRGDVRKQQGSHVWPDGARELMAVLAAAERGMAVQGQSTTTYGPGYGPGGGHAAGPAGAGYGGAPAHGPGGAYGAAPGYTPGHGVSGVTEGVRNMDVHDHAGPSTAAETETTPPLPPRTSKAAEAAAEARANEPLPAGPPSYYEDETHHGGELPPAYEDDGVPRPGLGDTKGPAGPGY